MKAEIVKNTVKTLKPDADGYIDYSWEALGMSGDGKILEQWDEFEYDNPEPQGISRVFLTHPELNASAVARRVGISQSLMAQYINGMKKPSKERESLILNEVKAIGRELVAI